jgi:uroporphyrinogen III methyltransferase / synthase
VSLAGLTILLTRDPDASAGFIAEAERLGARVLLFPVIAVQPPLSWEACDRAARALDGYTALAFTSANGVRGFRARCDVLGIPPERLARLKVYAVGARTAGEAGRLGFTVAAIPEHFSAAGLAQLFGGTRPAGLRVLLPQGDIAREELAVQLSALGAVVDPIVVYRTAAVVPPGAEEVWTTLASGGIGVVTFASPSAVAAFAAIYPAGRLGPLDVRTAIAAIGPTTGEAVRDQGWTPACVAAESTMAGLLEAIISHVG